MYQWLSCALSVLATVIALFTQSEFGYVLAFVLALFGVAFPIAAIADKK